MGKQGLAVAHCGGKDTDGRGPRKCWLVWALSELPISAPRAGPIQQPTGSRAGTPQAKQQARQENNPTHQQTGCLNSSWAYSHLKTSPLTWHCPPEEKDPAPLPRGQAPVLPKRKPAQAPGPTTPTRGQTLEARGTTVLQPVERRPQTQKFRQSEIIEKYVAKNGTR